ncbi:MAG TPA: hypothetical protein VFH68_26310 [Polyangia bacterium]|jgi:hypothetical protein|nr:hypothetical protein [Polyangia bacterium]
MKRATSILTAAVWGALALPGFASAAPGAEEPPLPPPPAAPVSGAAAATPSSATPAPASPPSDHDLVVGHLGVEARRIAAAPYPLTLSQTGCPSVPPPPSCTVELGAVGVRYWKTRNLAWNAALALAVGGGKQGLKSLDTYVGAGPIVGVTLLLGNWRHLAVGATPEASFIYFRPGGGAPASKLYAFRAQLEGELHFGFVDVPALSIGITAGLAFQYESAPGVSTWSVSVGEARSVWGALSNLFIRYYL